jgi:hypothetical protein
VHACNVGTWKAVAGELQVPGQPETHEENWSQN